MDRKEKGTVIMTKYLIIANVVIFIFLMLALIWGAGYGIIKICFSMNLVLAAAIVCVVVMRRG